MRHAAPGCQPGVGGASERVQVEPVVAVWITQVRFTDQVWRLLPSYHARAGAGWIAADEVRRFVGTALPQEDRAELPSPDGCVHETVHAASELATPPHRKVVDRSSNPTLTPRAVDVAILVLQIIEIHRTMAGVLIREMIRSIALIVCEVLRERVSRVERNAASEPVIDFNL